MQRGASFFAQLLAAEPEATELEVLAALWDLVWSGEVTNDSFAALRAHLSGGGARAARGGGAAAAKRRARPGRLTRLGPPAGAGRWSLVDSWRTAPPADAPAAAGVPAADPAHAMSTRSAHAVAMQLLDRYGVVTREAVLAEGVVGGYAAVYQVLKVLEERGQVRRGYFVAGLGAAQFAMPGAVDRLRSERRDVSDAELHPEQLAEPVVLAATDPAQPYGSIVPWPDTSGRPARTVNSWVVLRNGLPLVWLDQRSHALVTFAGAGDPSWAAALVALVKQGRVRSIEIRKVDGEALQAGSDVVAALAANGFVEGYRGWVLRA